MQIYFATIDGRSAFLVHGLHEIQHGAVEISAEAHAALMDGQSAGLEIVPGEDGRPELREPPPQAPVVPASISRTQMLLGLAAGGVITDAEAIAAATMGAVPAVVDAVFAQLPPADALAARVKWAVEPTILRAHPLIAAMISAGVVTEQQADDLFLLAATR